MTRAIGLMSESVLFHILIRIRDKVWGEYDTWSADREVHVFATSRRILDMQGCDACEPWTLNSTRYHTA